MHKRYPAIRCLMSSRVILKVREDLGAVSFLDPLRHALSGSGLSLSALNKRAAKPCHWMVWIQV
jgi:hypothetical protein